MKFSTKLVLFILTVLSTVSFSQSSRQLSGGGDVSGSVSGKVIDAQSGKPFEYATVVVFREKDKHQVNGSIARTDGYFEVADIAADKYYLEVTFIGYEKLNISFEIKASQKLNLGEIKLNPKAVNLKNIVVEGQRVPFTYQVDKKVINVDKFATSVSGNAADILQNIPSISVDVDGNVSLRGSGSFKVLIDGRPSIVDAQDQLKQIPASSIENIEIITNPSVKYDAEGVAGIINLVLKKDENNGLSGMADLNVGLKDKYDSDFLLEYKKPAYTSVFSVNYRKMHTNDTRSEYRIYNSPDYSSQTSLSGDCSYRWSGYGIRGGINFNLGTSDVLGFNGRYDTPEGMSSSVSNYTEQSGNSLLTSYRNKTQSGRNGNSYALSLNYQHKFPMKDHHLSADITFNSSRGNGLSISEMISNMAISDGKKTTDGGPGGEFRTKIDYTLPFNDSAKFEAGIQGTSRLSNQSTGYFELNTALGQYLQLSDYSFGIKSRSDGYSLYSLYSAMWDNLGCQIGLRGEYTYRKINITKNNDIFTIGRFDYFPTLHFSYKISSDEQFTGSYARRIQRPDDWQLEPFDTWADANTVHRGNPSLLPELIDSYEFGFQMLIAKIVSFTSELYHRKNNSKIDGIRSVYSDHVTLQTFDNIGKDYSTGAELMASAEFFKLWNLDLMANLYDYRLKTDLDGQPSSKESFNWHARMNNSLMLSNTLHLQLSADYNSPEASFQSKTEGSFSLDLAIRQEFLEKALSLTLQARNVLNTARWQSTTENSSYYAFSSTKRETPVIMLNLRYTINNYKDLNNGNE
ncbi:MAG: TonB-dependent receptor [Ignavibacteria bacterium]|jgi:outer membrane receptor protein involved in Fe transport|nr:TonB-dependent receptor [Ignavibacteria bacterium]